MIIYMGRRLNALLEIFLVYILVLLVPMIIVPTIYRLFPNYLNFTLFGLMSPAYTFISDLAYLAIVLIVLAVTRRSLSRSGVSLRNLPGDFKIAMICITTFIVLPLVIEFVIAWLPWNLIGINLNGVVGSTLYYAIELLVPLVTVIILILFFLFVGPIEELLFRGYIQSRLNEAFDRPYKFFGVSWGIGLIITTLLFSFMHVTNYTFNPLTGNYNLNWLWGSQVFIFGLAMCFIREKTGNIVAPAIVHGASDFLSNIISYI